MTKQNRGWFKPGNDHAYVHGGRSSRNGELMAQKTVEQLTAEALESYPWLANKAALLGLLVSNQRDIEHYAGRVAEHEKYRRAAKAEQSRVHKAKAESALRETLRLVEAARTGAVSALPAGVDPVDVAQWRMRARYSGKREGAVAWLAARGLEPDPLFAHRYDLWRHWAATSDDPGVVANAKRHLAEHGQPLTMPPGYVPELLERPRTDAETAIDYQVELGMPREECLPTHEWTPTHRARLNELYLLKYNKPVPKEWQ